jgi:hypothetical protein
MHLLEGKTYAPKAAYNECMLMPGLATAALALGGMTALGVGLYFSLTRWLLTATVLPAPGQGPTEAARKAGYFTVHTMAKVRSPVRSLRTACLALSLHRVLRLSLSRATSPCTRWPRYAHLSAPCEPRVLPSHFRVLRLSLSRAAGKLFCGTGLGSASAGFG